MRSILCLSSTWRYAHYWTDVQDLAELPLFEKLEMIENSLNPESAASSSEILTCQMALKWCDENKVTLRKINSTLEFDLRLQEFIQLTRFHLLDAIHYARKNIKPYIQSPENAPKATQNEVSGKNSESQSREALKAMGLLAHGNQDHQRYSVCTLHINFTGIDDARSLG